MSCRVSISYGEAVKQLHKEPGSAVIYARLSLSCLRHSQSLIPDLPWSSCNSRQRTGRFLQGFESADSMRMEGAAGAHYLRQESRYTTRSFLRCNQGRCSHSAER
ncbi:hypothetical protein QQF64_031168 [Cirrhinus molitorella]|uniref:Uncharacterized protein n=1 Tax=Cirrhinus molitorella TaxID=172907 RepID=A0ABR3N5P9_9TELE